MEQSNRESIQKLREDIMASSAVATDDRIILLQLARIVAHLESERGTLQRIIVRTDRHERILIGDEKEPGVAYQVRQILEEQKSRKKVLYSILASVLAVLMIKLGELLFMKHP